MQVGQQMQHAITAARDIGDALVEPSRSLLESSLTAADSGVLDIIVLHEIETTVRHLDSIDPAIRETFDAASGGGSIDKIRASLEQAEDGMRALLEHPDPDSVNPNGLYTRVLAHVSAARADSIGVANSLEHQLRSVAEHPAV